MLQFFNGGRSGDARGEFFVRERALLSVADVVRSPAQHYGAGNIGQGRASTVE
jgi:hypothetical protein